MIAYTPFAILGAFTFVVLMIIYLVQKKDHKESARELNEYLHRWQIESDQNAKNAQRILDDIQKTNRDNSIFLHMMLERVDKSSQQS